MKLSDYNTIVIKIGSSLIIDEKSSSLRLKWLKSFAKEVKKLQKAGVDVVLVCSGSIASASKTLGKLRSELNLEESQAYAAFGQAILIGNLRRIFARQGLDIAQILITNEDCENRRRYLNMRATIGKLLEMNIIPVINENDTISTDEIKFGDNDGLAARTVGIVDADLLVLLSDVDGLYDKNPKGNKDAKFLAEVKSITKKIEDLAGEDTSHYGTGGMASKIAAPKIATEFGANVIITKGEGNKSLFGLDKNKKHTLFKAKKSTVSSRKKWLSGLKSKASVVINKCAVDVLKKGGCSLLPVGVVKVRGSFKRGDAISVETEKGKKIALGLSGMDVSDLKKVMGKSSSDIKGSNSAPKRLNVIHYDDMALLR